MEMENNSQQIKWIVYCTFCTVNKKIYIGYHKTSDPYGWDKYIGGGWDTGTMIKNPSTAYENALKKYGYSKFIRTTLKVFDTEKEAKDLEAFLVDLEFIKRRDTYNTTVGGNGGGNFKKFYQYDLNGNFIKEWDSRQELINFYKLESDTNRIHRAVVNKWVAFDSYWTNYKADKLNIDEYRINKFSTIYQFDKNYKLINTYSSANDAATSLNISINFINEAISKKIPAREYFFTKNPLKVYDIIKTYKDRMLNLNDNSISIYNEAKEIVKTFKSLNDLSKYLSVKPSLIKEAIDKEIQINNYYISYGYKDVFSGNKLPGLKVNQYDLDGNFIKQWPTISSCAKEHPKVRLVLSGSRNHTHGYTFKIADELKI